MHKRSLTDGRDVLKSITGDHEVRIRSRPSTALTLTRYNEGIFKHSAPKSATVSGSTTVKNSVILRKSANHRSTKSISKGTEDRLFSDFLSNIGLRPNTASTSKLEVARPSSRIVLRDTIASKTRLPIGDTYPTVIQDRKKYLRQNLDSQTKAIYRTKVKNLEQHTKPTSMVTKYDTMVAEYHDLYLACLSKKKEPILTNMIREKKKAEIVPVEDEFRLFVKYDSDIKGRF